MFKLQKVSFTEYSAAHQNMAETRIANIDFVINDGMPLGFEVNEIEFFGSSLVSPSILLRQFDHEIANQVVRAIFLSVVHVADQCFLNICIHEILSLYLQIDDLVPDRIVGALGCFLLLLSADMKHEFGITVATLVHGRQVLSPVQEYLDQKLCFFAELVDQTILGFGWQGSEQMSSCSKAAWCLVLPNVV